MENCNALLKESVEPDAHHSALMGLHGRGENSSQLLRKYLEWGISGQTYLALLL